MKFRLTGIASTKEEVKNWPQMQGYLWRRGEQLFSLSNIFTRFKDPSKLDMNGINRLASEYELYVFVERRLENQYRWHKIHQIGLRFDFSRECQTRRPMPWTSKIKSVQNVAILGASLVKLIQNIHSDKCKFVDLIEIKKTCEWLIYILSRVHMPGWLRM